MIYISTEEIANLPDDPEQAFIALESLVRERYEAAYKKLDDNESPEALQRRYLSIIIPAAKHYGIQGLSDWVKPGPKDQIWEYFHEFISELDYRTTELRLKGVEREKEYSVLLDGSAKVKLRSLLQQIRQTVDKMDISVAKKERLFARINALQEEIDRDRTRYQAFAALMIEATDDVGEAAKRLEPVIRLVERVGAAIGLAKRDEDNQRRLPPPSKPKQIEPPKNARRSFVKDLEDDEIPF